MFSMEQFIPQISHNVSFSPHMVRIPAWLSFFFKKKIQIVEVALIRSFNDCLFAETSSTPAQVVAVGNSREEEPSSILETFCHSD